MSLLASELRQPVNADYITTTHSIHPPYNIIILSNVASNHTRYSRYDKLAQLPRPISSPDFFWGFLGSKPFLRLPCHKIV